MKRKSRLLITWVPLVIGLLALASTASTADSREYQIKAAFLFNFAKFIDWPPKVFSSASAPIVVGVLGEDPFGAQLDTIFQGQTIQGRPFVVKRLKDPKACPECHLLFISASESARMKEVLESAKGPGVVTISDMPAFEQAGGVIRLFTDANKVRFAINPQAASSAGVKISSQLLRLSQPGAGGP